MKTLQGLYLSAFFLLMGSGCILTAAELFINRAPFPRMSRPMLSAAYNSVANFSSSHHLPNNVLTARRTHSTIHNHFFNSGRVSDREEMNIYKRYEDLVSNCKLAMQELQQIINQYNGKNVERVKTSRNTNRTFAEIVPFNSQHFSSLKRIPAPDSSLVPVQKCAPELQKSMINSEPKIESNSISANNNLSFYDSSKRNDHMNNDLVNRIMRSASDPDKINIQDLEAICGLYAALVLRPADGITMVLECKTDTYKSGIYGDVVRHVKSKNSTLETYRKIYVRLMQALGNRGMLIIYNAIEDIIKEREAMRNMLTMKSLVSMQGHDYIDLIAEAWHHPLYCVQPYEIKAIVEVYTTLIHRPKQGITNVLNYKIDTYKSGIYGDIVKYVKSKNSDIESYRNIFARVSKSLNKEGMKILYKIIDDQVMPTFPQEETSLSSKEFSSSQLEQNGSVILNNSLSDDDCEANPLTDRNIADVQADENIIQTANDHVSKKEYKIFRRLYDLLPQYDENSISEVILGLKKEGKMKSDILKIIKQISQENEKMGDEKINFDFFRRIYWLYNNSISVEKEKKINLPNKKVRSR